MTTTTTPNKPAARTRAYRDPKTGNGLWIGDGGVSQEGKLQLYTCNGCGSDVVWATSTRTGRKYLCGVQRGAVGRFYRKDLAHDCGKAQAVKAASVEQYQAHVARTEASAVIARGESMYEVVMEVVPAPTMSRVLSIVAHLLDDANGFTAAWETFYGK